MWHRGACGWRAHVRQEARKQRKELRPQPLLEGHSSVLHFVSVKAPSLLETFQIQAIACFRWSTGSCLRRTCSASLCSYNYIPMQAPTASTSSSQASEQHSICNAVFTLVCVLGWGGCVCLACLCVWALHAQCHKRRSDPLELALETVVRCHVSARN